MYCISRRCVLSASKPVCKLEVSSFELPERERRTRGEIRNVPTGCSSTPMPPKPYRSIRSSPRVELLLLPRARGGVSGARGRERGARLKFAEEIAANRR